MAVDTELQNIRTLLGKSHTTATAKTFTEIKKIDLIDDTERILVYPGEIIKSSFMGFYTKRYLVKLSEVGEAGLTAMYNDICIGLEKMNKRIVITSFTRLSTMIHGEIAYSNKAYENRKKSNRWEMDIFLDITWSTS